MDTFSIGICAEDTEARRVVTTAFDTGCRPIFSNARGTFVDVQFVPDQRLDEKSVPGESFPLLYGWIERVSADALIQLIEPTLPSRQPLCLPGVLGRDFQEGPAKAPSSSSLTDAVVDLSTKREIEDRESAGRVAGSLSFLLHVVSMLPSEQTPGLALLDSTPVEEEARQRVFLPASETTSSTREKHLSSSPSLFTPKGVPLGSILNPNERAALELRDDREVVRNAVETVLRYSQLVAEHPGSKGLVYLDDSTGREYIKFEQTQI